MKKTVFLSAVFLFSVFFTACKKESPVEYNNKIVQQQVEVVKKIDQLKKSIDDFNILPQNEAINEMNKAYDAAVLQIDTAITVVKGMDAFKSDTTLKNAALNLFISYKKIVMQNYKKVIENYKLPDAMFGAKEAAETQQLINDAKTKLEVAYADFVKVQKEFAKNNNLKLD